MPNSFSGHKPVLSRLLAGAALLAALAGSLWPAEIDPKRYLEDVKYLSSEQMKGRGAGTPELDMAAQYLAREFGKAGLKPVGGSDYLQAFRVTTNARLGQKNRLDVIENGRRRTLNPGEDFQPFNFSKTGTVSAGLVFAGYGITAREYGYDDYQGLDPKGKFVVILRHEPQENNEKSVFAGRALTEHAQFTSKASNAKAHGANCVVVACPMCHVNLDMKQGDIEKAMGKTIDLPVYYLSDVVGMALGLSEAALGVDKHFVAAVAK